MSRNPRSWRGDRGSLPVADLTPEIHVARGGCHWATEAATKVRAPAGEPIGAGSVISLSIPVGQCLTIAPEERTIAGELILQRHDIDITGPDARAECET